MGIKASEIYQSGSDWLRAEDLQQQEHVVTIASIGLAELQEGNKLEVHFVGRKKALLLNKTNSDQIVYAYGDDTDGWIGKAIILYPTIVPFQGKNVPAIRVRPQLRMAPPTPPPAPVAPQPAPAAVELPGEDEDDIPW